MDEKKTYSVVGTVTIGTDEYRDLIETNITNEKDASTERSKRWNLESDLRKANDKISALNKALEEYTGFIKADDQAAALYKAYLAEKALKEVQNGN